MVTAGTVTGLSEGQESTVNDETQVLFSPFCSTSFLTREKAGDCAPTPEWACPPGAGSAPPTADLPRDQGQHGDSPFICVLRAGDFWAGVEAEGVGVG